MIKQPKNKEELIQLLKTSDVVFNKEGNVGVLTKSKETDDNNEFYKMKTEMYGKVQEQIKNCEEKMKTLQEMKDVLLTSNTQIEFLKNCVNSKLLIKIIEDLKNTDD